ncbi:hypothetical protein AM493_14210 [Flavobacterium akiainvivens]|uniref:Transmembrane protein n=1 Tax=Flavobacterium akiainvivens TaxID=1202724 RepID=A0A0M8MJX4_9FLAO|nr:hypothetical protein [Flavobacterium akiainvivens]KOS07058.1 hypothetical protein AM493_14210 [Flavobacterium akiainvivens]SFQ58669.1 hypothetical protein SAMN05444144_10931 [Flavobacterium akiainvivens]
MKQEILLEDKIANAYAMFVLILMPTFSKWLPVWCIALVGAGAFIFATRKFIRNKNEGKSNVRFYIGLGFIALSVIMGIFFW